MTTLEIINLVADAILVLGMLYLIIDVPFRFDKILDEQSDHNTDTKDRYKTLTNTIKASTIIPDRGKMIPCSYCKKLTATDIVFYDDTKNEPSTSFISCIKTTANYCPKCGRKISTDEEDK